MKKIVIGFSFFAVLLVGCEEIFFEEDISDVRIELIAPSNEAVFDLKEVSLNWSSAEGVDEYLLQIVSPSFSNSNQLVKDTLLTATNYTFNLLSNKYQWRVKGINSAYETSYSTYSFEIVSLNTEDQIVLTSPENELITNQVEQVLTWNAMEYAQKYTVQIWNPNTTGTLIEETEVETTQTTVTFEEGNFIWQVNAVNSTKSTDYTSRSILVDATAPNTPELTSPENEVELLDKKINFSWQRETIGGSVEIDSLYIYQDALLSQLVFKDRMATKEFELELLPNDYYWFVKSFDQAGNVSESSVLNTFTVLEGISTKIVELVSPEDELTTNISTQLFTWNLIENASNYTVQILKNNGTNPLVFEFDTSLTQKEISLQDGTYYWQVKAMNAFDETQYSKRTMLVDTQEPTIPELVAPINMHSQIESVVRFEYTRTPKEGSQEIDSLFVYADQSLTTLVLKSEVITNQYQEFEVGMYYWYLKSYDLAGNESDKSEVNSFSIESDFSLQQVVLNSPEDELITNNAQQTYEWLTVEGATDYRIQIHTIDNSQTILEDYLLPITTKTISLEDGSYRWNVRAQNNTQNTAYSSRTILIDTTNPEKATLLNPADEIASNNTTVEFRWSTAEQNTGSNEITTVSVYTDITLNNEFFSEDLSGTSLFKNIIPGTYYWHVTIADAAGNIGEQSNMFSFTIE